MIWIRFEVDVNVGDRVEIGEFDGIIIPIFEKQLITCQMLGYKLNTQYNIIQFLVPDIKGANELEYNLTRTFKDSECMKNYLDFLESWMQNGDHVVDIRKGTFISNYLK